jgi:hypothetical protein
MLVGAQETFLRLVRHLFYFWNVIGFILIFGVFHKTLTKGEAYDSEQIYQNPFEFKRIIRDPI